MDRIYHEKVLSLAKFLLQKQMDRFCAQHCLNSLLQGPYFTLESLVEIAHTLDDRERMTRDVSEADCLNNDESGDFSIQVCHLCNTFKFTTDPHYFSSLL